MLLLPTSCLIFRLTAQASIDLTQCNNQLSSYPSHPVSITPDLDTASLLQRSSDSSGNDPLIPTPPVLYPPEKSKAMVQCHRTTENTYHSANKVVGDLHCTGSIAVKIGHQILQGPVKSCEVKMRNVKLFKSYRSTEQARREERISKQRFTKACQLQADLAKKKPVSR